MKIEQRFHLGVRSASFNDSCRPRSSNNEGHEFNSAMSEWPRYGTNLNNVLDVPETVDNAKLHFDFTVDLEADLL